MAEIKFGGWKQGDKPWIMHGGKPVQVTVVGGHDLDGAYRISIPGENKNWSWEYWMGMFKTKKDCLEWNVRSEQRSIEQCKKHISQYKEFLKEAKHWHATWSKMLQEEINGNSQV